MSKQFMLQLTMTITPNSCEIKKMLKNGLLWCDELEILPCVVRRVRLLLVSRIRTA